MLVTTGLRDELPDVPGLGDRWANDVLHCPYCHGWEVRDRAAGVIWNGPETTRYVQIVRQWTRDLVLFAPNGALTAPARAELAARAISLVEGPIDRLVVEDDVLTSVAMADGSLIARQVLFVQPRLVPHSELLAGLGAELDQDGWVTAAMAGATTVPGVWVAGNVANPRAQVITAAGEGSAAAIAINADLVDEDVRAAVDQVSEGLATNPA
ncbi:NAD(P)/FAD-dependent oxidoreductase [Pedococcus soli]